MSLAYIFWTTNSLDEAKGIIQKLLENKLIACANILPNIQSLYIWDQKIQEDDEVKVILKTKKSLFSSIEKFILQNCNYEVPEISMCIMSQVHNPYLQWLNKSTL